MTQSELEKALDSGKLQAQVTSGRWWFMRRNGKTRIWKTRPGKFYLPTKVGYREHYALTEKDLDSPYFRVVE